MSESGAVSPGRIFISYRREETAYPAGWLYDRLSDHYGGQVFKDVDSIQLGDDFVEAITRAVGSCDVLLALVGDQWLSITDAVGRRRLDDPADFVRVEIEAALTRNVRVIPAPAEVEPASEPVRPPAALAGAPPRTPDSPPRPPAPAGPPGRHRRRWMLALGAGDRKSTRLNSSHVRISYAVFCLKKKK